MKGTPGIRFEEQRNERTLAKEGQGPFIFLRPDRFVVPLYQHTGIFPSFRKINSQQPVRPALLVIFRKAPFPHCRVADTTGLA
jgi:hypothetical protein